MLQGAHTTPYGSLGCDVLPYIFHNSFAQSFQLGVHFPDCLHLVQFAAGHVVGTEMHCGERVLRELLIGQSCVDVGANFLDIFFDLGAVDGHALLMRYAGATCVGWSFESVLQLAAGQHWNGLLQHCVTRAARLREHLLGPLFIH